MNRQTKAQILSDLLAVKRVKTMRTMQYERLKPFDDNRIRTRLIPFGTETGRLASKGDGTRPWFSEPLTNLQNLNKKVARLDPLYNIREILIPTPGYAFVECDLSQVEMVLTAAYSEDWEKVARYEEGEDEHTRTGLLFGGSASDPATRILGKFANHSLNYGLSARGFKQKVNKDVDIHGISVSETEAKRYVGAYHRANPLLLQWWSTVRRVHSTVGQLTNAYGRRRAFLAHSVGLELISYLPSSTAADHLNHLLVKAVNKFTDCRLVLQVHDSVLFEVPIARVRKVCREMRDLMTKSIRINGHAVTVLADVSVGYDNWGNMKEVK